MIPQFRFGPDLIFLVYWKIAGFLSGRVEWSIDVYLALGFVRPSQVGWLTTPSNEISWWQNWFTSMAKNKAALPVRSPLPLMSKKDRLFLPWLCIVPSFYVGWSVT